MGLLGALGAVTPLAHTTPVRAAPAPPHMMVIVDENTSYASSDGTPYVVGNAKAPYINGLVSTYEPAVKWYSDEHNSPLDYMDLLGGLHTCSVSTPCKTSTLVDELGSAGIPWLAYMDGLGPGVQCYTGHGSGASGSYAQDHNPFMYFKSTATKPECNNVVAYPGGSQVASTLDGSNPPDFVWVTPSQCDDMHSRCVASQMCFTTCPYPTTQCPLTADNLVSQGDYWLCENLPSVLSSSWFTQGNSAIILTFDEGAKADTQDGTIDTGGHILTLVISNSVKGVSYSARGDHYATLAGIEQAYGVNCLNSSTDCNTSTHGNLFPALGLGDSSTGTISGVVSDADTPSQSPLSGATVSCTCSGSHATTNASGAYSFSGVTPGSYTLTVSDGNGPGYVTQTINSVGVSGGQTTTENVSLTEDNSISGVVTSQQTGDPISGASVACSGSGGMSSCPNNNPATTNSAGFYYLTGTVNANGPYTLSVSATGYVPQVVNNVTVPPGGAVTENVVLTPVSPPLAVVQNTVSASGAAVTSYTASGFSPTTPGNLLVVSTEFDAGAQKASGSVVSVSDSNSDTWTRAVAVDPATRIGVEIWYLPASPATISSVTLTFSKAVNPVVRFYEISGATATPLDVSASGSGTGAGPDSGSVLTNAASEVALGTIGFALTTATISNLPPGFTNSALVRNAATNYNNSEQSGYEVTSATGSYSYSGTLSSSEPWAAVIATFE